MKKIFLILPAFLGAICLLFSSCDRNISKDDCLSYQEKAFEAEVSVKGGTLAFSAKVSGGALLPENGFSRDLTVTFTAPSSLKGISVTQAEGKTTVSLGELSFAGDGSTYDPLVDFAHLFALDAIPVSVELEGENTRITLIGTNDTLYSLLLSKNGLPLEIGKDNGLCITVENYSFK